MRQLIRVFATSLAALALLVTSIASAAPAAAQDNDKPTISIGAVAYTEQSILGEMYALILEDAGYEVERNFDLASEAILHQAYLSGDIDVSVQYTGSGLVSILGIDVPSAVPSAGGTPAASIPEQAYDIVSREYQERWGIVWLDQLGFNNTYALAVTSETADELDLKTVSDLKDHAGDMTVGTDVSFPARQDGLPGLTEAYDLEFGDLVTMDVGLLYSAVDQGQVDVIVGYSTDGRIPALDLVVLEDDKSYFPPYYAAPVVNKDLYEEHPEVVELLNQLAGDFDNDTMAQLNAQVDEGGKQPREVAEAYLEEQGILDSGD